MQPVWRVEMLGALRAIQGENVIARFRTRRVASLLAYLASFKNQAHSRDLLADLLWPDIDFETSRRNLRQAIYALRKVLEPTPQLAGQVLLTVNDGFQLHSEMVITDVQEFESLVAKGKLQQAVDLYKGQLLPGFSDSWVSLEQIRLEDLYLFALSELADTADAASAIGHLRAGLRIDSENPKWHVRLIERYLEMGQPSRAQVQLTELQEAIFGGDQHLMVGLQTRIDAALKPSETSRQPRRVALPIVASKFFGREREIGEITSRLMGRISKLVTLQGPAGVGKTRSAIESGKVIAQEVDWNVIFVPLADQTTIEEVLEAIVFAFQANKAISEPGLEDVLNLTKARPTLLILDNLEQVVDPASSVVAQLLAASENLSFLCTSRLPLQIEQEQILALEPLPVPSEHWRGSESLESFPSVQLFLDRIRAIRPETSLDSRNADVVADLCIRFDGLPLALEIAAGLSGSFSLRQMVRHLPDRQTEILNRRRDSPARHKSLKAAIDWGFLWLDPEICRLFLKLSVFRRSFGLEAAKAIGLQGEGSIVNSIAALVDCSLVRRISSDDELAPRFSLLVAFREYAESRILEEEMAQLREAHADYFAGRTPPARPFWNVEEQTAVHMEIESDYHNFLAAVEFSLSVGNLDRATDLLAILAMRWLTQGPKVAEREFIQRLANHPDRDSLEPSKRIQLLRMMGTTLIRSGKYQAAYESCEEALAIANASTDTELIAISLSGLSVCAGYLNHLEECAALNKKVLELVGDRNLHLAERSHLGLGSVYANLGQFDNAKSEFQKARRLSERLRGGEPDALIVVNQAETSLALKQLDVAARFSHEAIRISNRLRDEFTLAMALSVLAKTQLESGSAESASATNREAVTRFRNGSFDFWILRSLRNQAIIFSRLGRFDEAATFMSLTAELSASPESPSYAQEDQAMREIRAGLSSESFEACWAKGLALTAEDAFAILIPPLAA